MQRLSIFQNVLPYRCQRLLRGPCFVYSPHYRLLCVLQLLRKRLSDGARKGEEGVLLDGFPRTRNQAEALLTFADVQLALNLSLREEVASAPCAHCCTCA